MIYVYAILEGREGLARGVPGIAGAPLRALSHLDVSAAYSDDPPARLEPTEEALLQHEQALEALMATRAVLPRRFGSTVSSTPELWLLLAERHDEFAAALAAVRGRVEMGVRALVREQPDGAEHASGRAYLAAKLDRRRTAAQVGESVDRELAPLAAASSLRITAAPRPGFAAAYLVDRPGVGQFRRRFEAVRAARPDLALACTGPWPPFSFTEPQEPA